MRPKNKSKNECNQEAEALQEQIKKQQGIINKLQESLEWYQEYHKRETAKLESTADFYRNKARPLRNYISKFFDQLDEQIHELHLHEGNLIYAEKVKSFIKDLEWKIIMVRKVI